MIITHARRALVAVLVAAAAACSEPGVSPRLFDPQSSASNLRDWSEAAHRLVSSMETQGFIPSAHPPPPGRHPFPAPYYVNMTTEGSAFLEVVRQSIEKELLFRNLAVARSAAGATVINLSVDVVQWGSDTGTEIVWRASIINGADVVMQGSEILYVAGRDVPLYVGPGVHQSIVSPGVAMIGAARPLQYAH